jgi:N-acetylneuraminic acid mutarotase
MATGRYSPGAAVLDGKLYVFGGYLQGVGQLASCEVYESGKGWSGCGALNTKRVGLRGAALGGKVYAVGGYDGSDKLKTMEVYDPATGQWSEAPDMPTARTAPAVAALDGKLYVAGGMDEAYLSALEIFDPATQQWSAGMPMPVKKGSAAAAAMPEKHVLLVIGGIGNTGPGEITSTDRVERYDPATGAWTVYPTGLPGFRGDLMAVYLPGGVPVVVALGGELNLDKKGETYLGYFDL